MTNGQGIGGVNPALQSAPPYRRLNGTSIIKRLFAFGDSGLGLHLSHRIGQHSSENIIFHTRDFFNRYRLAIGNGNLRADFE
jgi:hypothetical protein